MNPQSSTIAELTGAEPRLQSASAAPMAPALTASLPPDPNPPASRRRRSARMQALLPATLSVVLLAFLLGLWQWATVTERVSRFVLPMPADTARAFWRGMVSNGIYRQGLWVTGQEIALGFFIGAAIGVLLAAALSVSHVAERAVYPYVVFLQVLPKVAVAPLLIIWLGFGMKSKVVLVAMLVAFPVLVNTLEGLKAASQSRLDLLASFGASRWQVFTQVRLPTAAPYIFAGLDIGIVFSPVGAVVAEFVGATQGLGVAVQQAQQNLDTAGVMALLIILGLLGISLHALLVAVRRRVVFWERFTRSGTARPK